MKFLSSLNWPVVTLLCVLAVCVTALVVTGIVPKETFLALVTGIVGWLFPSPVQSPKVPVENK